MYLPKVFSVADTDLVRRFVHANAFGMLIVPQEGGPPEISHLPFLLDEGEGGAGRLRVHVARANPIWRLASTASRVIVVFTGPHTYVSPTWYGTPSEHVPTWNYAVVHAHCGTATIAEGDALEAMVGDLSAQHEDPETGWRIGDVDAAFRAQLLLQIVGMSLPVERFEAKLKLSQNREPADRERVMAELRRRGLSDDLAMLEWMTQQVAGTP